MLKVLTHQAVSDNAPSPGDDPRDFFSVAIRTSPREVDYLQGTVSQFNDHSLHIYAEPGSKNPEWHNATWNENSKKLGIVDNFINALTHAPRRPWVMVCEDDIEIINWLPIYQAMLYYRGMEDLAFLSPYCAFPHGNRYAFGWKIIQPTVTTGWCGALCCIFPEHVIDKFIAKLKALQIKGTQLDVGLGMVADQLNLAVVAHVPTLIHHTGVKSSFLDNTRLDRALLQNREPYLGWNCSCTNRKC